MQRFSRQFRPSSVIRRYSASPTVCAPSSRTTVSWFSTPGTSLNSTRR
ncbi:hypothetical protein IEO21_07763 [Rhodonia placenta]|uniref:Uncharacterized protein n=1 Tax=Rhodonia placenta TaxID=104341 RepID=A0A8H7NXW8_9APHY|nr:hypothetical protein IEO21_07763 [Postia placenta]